MHNKLKYELNNMKKMKHSVFWTTLGSYLGFLIMFGAIGYTDREPDNNVLEHFSSLMGLVSIISLLFITILGSVKACHYIVGHYMGDNKIRLYMFPNGRGSLFMHKVMAFIYLFDLMELLGLIIVNMALWIFNSITSFLIGNNIFMIIPSIVTVILLSDFILIVSITLGVRFTSKVVTVVSGVIILLISCNIFANNLAYYPFLSIGIALILFIISLLPLNYCRKYIDHDEISR